MLKIGKSHILTVNVGWYDFQHGISFYVIIFENRYHVGKESMDRGSRKYEQIFPKMFSHKVVTFQKLAKTWVRTLSSGT